MSVVSATHDYYITIDSKVEQSDNIDYGTLKLGNFLVDFCDLRLSADGYYMGTLDHITLCDTEGALPAEFIMNLYHGWKSCLEPGKIQCIVQESDGLTSFTMRRNSETYPAPDVFSFAAVYDMDNVHGEYEVSCAAGDKIWRHSGVF